MIRFSPPSPPAVLTAVAAQPAAAQSITVKVAGKSEAAVRADIHRAAETVCRDKQDFLVGVPAETEILQCERLTERKAMAQLGQVTVARTAPNQVAGPSLRRSRASSGGKLGPACAPSAPPLCACRSITWPIAASMRRSPSASASCAESVVVITRCRTNQSPTWL